MYIFIYIHINVIFFLLLLTFINGNCKDCNCKFFADAAIKNTSRIYMQIPVYIALRACANSCISAV